MVGCLPSVRSVFLVQGSGSAAGSLRGARFSLCLCFCLSLVSHKYKICHKTKRGGKIGSIGVSWGVESVGLCYGLSDSSPNGTNSTSYKCEDLGRGSGKETAAGRGEGRQLRGSGHLIKQEPRGAGAAWETRAAGPPGWPRDSEPLPRTQPPLQHPWVAQETPMGHFDRINWEGGKGSKGAYALQPQLPL